jgi:hypothetical protein
MEMTQRVSPIWLAEPAHLDRALERCVEIAAAGAPELYFRADDIGVPGRGFEALVEVFQRRRTALNLAVVPAWLTEARWEKIREAGRRFPELWCWHQHGWRHVNHEAAGKKQELGDGRPDDAVRRDIEKGRRRLRQRLGDRFTPVFTPPWNRCGAAALRGLSEMGFLAVSRTAGSRPAPPPGLNEVDVHVDLHTMKAPDPASGWRSLLSALEASLVSGRCGIMIHHQRMNAAAFGFLDRLLALLARRRLPAHRFDRLLQGPRSLENGVLL